MSLEDPQLLDRFHQVLVDEIRAHRPDLLTSPFTIAEIYQDLVPYRTHRDRLGVEMNGDYEHLLLRLLAGEGGYLVLEADAPRQAIQAEFESSNPNTGLYREWAAADVRLNPAFLPGPLPSNEAQPPPEEPEPERQPEPETPEPEEAVSVEALAPTADTQVKGAGAASEPVLELETTPAADSSDAAEPEEVRVSEAAGSVEGPATCNWCRAELPNRENLNYCPFCGTDVHVVPCPSCGEALEPDWRFCIACGAEALRS